MFFRRTAPKLPTFDERIKNLRDRGFDVFPLDEKQVEVKRDGCGGIIQRQKDGLPRIVSVNLLVRGEMADLIDGGFQKFLQTATGLRRPALAEELKALHDFQEDLTDALGLESFYNESLGTVCDRHAYDRLQGRP